MGERNLFIALLLVFSISFLSINLVPNVSASHENTGCWTYNDSINCNSNNCSWHTDSWGSWCEPQGCWTADATNQTYCEVTWEAQLSGESCNWQPNNQNQEPWCDNNIGCCEPLGCWNGDSNFSSCSSINATLGGVCTWQNTSGWEYCGGTPGCCNTIFCDEAGTNQTLCDKLSSNFFMPCEFNVSGTGVCEDQGMSYLGGYDDCFDAGGNWNGTDCASSTFSGFAHCWSFDNQPNMCGNTSGCIYCGNTNISVAYDNSTGLVNSSTTNSSSFCYQKQLGFCEGHQSDASGLEYTDGLLNSSSLSCADIKIKQGCQFGPLPDCKWTNSSTELGNYCQQGYLSNTEQEALKPKLNGTFVTKCEDALTIGDCNNLTNNFLMPCKWDNKSTTFTYDDECTFNWNSSGFGGSKGEGNYYDIQKKDTCVLAGGKWVIEQICGATGASTTLTDAISSFSYCEPNTGQNSEDCDDACWACDSQSDCQASKLGYCNWDSKGCKEAPGIGGSTCSTSCDACNFIQFYNNGTQQSGLNASQAACVDSLKSCQWETDPYNPSQGWCIKAGKSGCSTDCFSCYNQNSCQNSTASCSWEVDSFGGNICKPEGYDSDKEVCFDGLDNDKNNLIDCADPECAFDSFCGGFVSGGCWGVSESLCNLTESPIGNGINCTWSKDNWEYQSSCKEPSWNCWQGDTNQTACVNGSQSLGITANACKWVNVSQQAGFDIWCDVNHNIADSCFSISNSSSCSGNCTWVNNSFGGGGGWCEFAPFKSCHEINNKSACNADSSCAWSTFYGYEGAESDSSGFCDVICFNSSFQGNSSACNAQPLCNAQETWCEPKFFGGGANGCWGNDGNKSACLENNATCYWFADINSNNNVTGTCSTNCGYCDPLFDYTVMEGMGKGHAFSLGTDTAEASVQDTVDIIDFSVDDSLGSGVAFIIRMQDMNSSFCKGKYVPGLSAVATGTGTVKTYIYMDIDENSGNGCTGIAPLGSNNETGFEFLMEYVSKYNTATNISESTKKISVCTSGSWQATNTPLYSDKTQGCGEKEGVIIAIEDEDLEKFSEFDNTKDISFFVSSANGTGTRQSPTDSLSGAIFTPGAIDFKFEDCFAAPGSDIDGDGLTIENDPDCTTFKQYGYIPTEDCYNNVDDNDDSLSDCADPQCFFEPKCFGSSTYNKTSDTTAPKMVWYEVEKFNAGAMVFFDTNKPSNGTFLFYKNDSTCKTINKTIYDIGTYNSLNNISAGIKEYKLWHDIPLDNFAFNSQSLGYSLTNGTTYYYKIKFCGLNNKCSTSSCLSFKTAKSNKFSDCPKCNPIMSFAFTAVSGVGITDPFGGMDFFIKGANDAAFSEVPDFCGLQIDWSNLTNADWKLTNQNSTKNWSITIGNASLANLDDSDKSVDGSNLVLTTSSDNNDYIGMNKEQWEIFEKTTPKYVVLTIPNTSAGCDELWKCDQNVTSCTNITGETGVNLTSQSSTGCAWQIPGDLGFSVYGPSDVPSGGGDDTTGGGGGGGSAVTTFWKSTYVTSDEQFEGGYTRQLGKQKRVKITIESEAHYVGVIDLTDTTATINVSSDPIQVILSEGEEEKFEVNGDNFYDLLVRLNSVNTSDANITIFKIDEEVPAEIIAAEGTSGEDETSEDTGTGAGGIGKAIEKGRILFWIIAIVIILAVLYLIYLLSKYLKEKYESRFDNKVKVVKNKMNQNKLFLVKKKKK